MDAVGFIDGEQRERRRPVFGGDEEHLAAFDGQVEESERASRRA